MTVTIETTTNDSVDLAGCRRLLKEIPDMWSENGLRRAADVLRMLSNDKTFLTTFVTDQLEQVASLKEFQHASRFSQQIIDLGGDNPFRLRANIWPPCKAERPANWEKSLFAYEMPHDHNADFLTVGYWGAGYETDIYEYDVDSTLGYAGEKVDIRFLERTQLHEGKVMYYRANRDIHTQIPAKEFSISINLLFADPNSTKSNRQYWFDVERGIIDSSIERQDYSPFIFLCRLAARIGGEETASMVEHIAHRHADPRVRLEGYEALADMDRSRYDLHWRRAAADQSGYVQRVARRRLVDDDHVARMRRPA